MDLQRHRELVRHGGPDHLLVVVERRAEDLSAGGVERLHLLRVELGAALERRQPGGPEDLVDPRAADARDLPLVAQQRVQVARLVEHARELLERGWRQRVRAERGHGLVLVELARREELGPGALLGAELAQAKLAPVTEPDQQPRAAVAQRGALVVELEPAGGHQVNQHHELARARLPASCRPGGRRRARARRGRRAEGRRSSW